MNRIFSVAAISLAFAFPAFAFASVISLSPTSIPVTPGKVFTVRVLANPNGVHVYTVIANISFDPALLSETKFEFAPKLLPLPMKDSDVVNNVTGVIIKTAGYIPGGITSTSLFGTITFKAKKVGVAHINVTTKSSMLDANSKNTVSGTQGSSSVVVALSQVAKPASGVLNKKPVKKVATYNKTAKKSAHSAASSAVKATSTSTTSTASTSATTSPLLASAVKGSGDSSGSMKFVLYLVAAIGLAVGIWFNRKRFLKQ